MQFTCKTCSKAFNKKLTLKEKRDKAKPKFCGQDCAMAYSRLKEIKQKRVYNRKALPNSSKEEKAFGELIKSYFPQLIAQYKIHGYNHHYDFYSPELNLIIEYNGVYWHNMPKNRVKDRNHLREATKNNIYMAVVTDVEWKIFIESGLPDKRKLVKLLQHSTKNMKN